MFRCDKLFQVSRSLFFTILLVSPITRNNPPKSVHSDARDPKKGAEVYPVSSPIV